MNQNTIKLLEYDKIKERLMEYAVSDMGRELVKRLEPSTDIYVIREWMNETNEARAIIDKSPGVPLYSLGGIEKVMSKLGKGIVLHPDELRLISTLLEAVKRIKRFMADKGEFAPSVCAYSLSMYELEDLAGEIDRCIVDNRIDDKASPELSKVRKKIAILEDRVKNKLESYLRSSAYRDFIQDTTISVKNGVYVIPVKKEYRRNIEGDVLDTSSSGSTVFIEPAGVKKLREELNLLRIEHEKEEYRILSYLTGAVDSYQKELSINLEAMGQYDFAFAKAKLSRSMDGNMAELNTKKYIRINNGKHPLIGRSCVPLNFEIGEGYRSLVITGPNTGGKTVALKTVGLLTMMVQSGLHVPVEDGSQFSVFRDILVDIGDGQSIEQSLSTFSSHIRNIISIMECSDPYTLVIIDELGTGTDPAEGMGIAIAVLEEIYSKGATTLATTHYSEIKTFATEREGFENGCMEFDIYTLKPLYRLKIGKSGESNALLIALRLGMEQRLIERAHQVAYKETKDYTGILKEEKIQVLKNVQVVEEHEAQVKRAERQEEVRGKIEKQKIEHTFKIGDCVYISTMNRTGIVCELENNKGELGVMVMKNKFKVSKKRLSLYVDGKELYPEEYNFDIIFETKENRKKRKQMGKRHVEGLEIELPGKQ